MTLIKPKRRHFYSSKFCKEAYLRRWIWMWAVQIIQKCGCSASDLAFLGTKTINLILLLTFWLHRCHSNSIFSQLTQNTSPYFLWICSLYITHWQMKATAQNSELFITKANRELKFFCCLQWSNPKVTWFLKQNWVLIEFCLKYSRS